MSGMCASQAASRCLINGEKKGGHGKKTALVISPIAVRLVEKWTGPVFDFFPGRAFTGLARSRSFSDHLGFRPTGGRNRLRRRQICQPVAGV